MKIQILVILTFITFSSLSQQQAWSFKEFGTSCSIDSTNKLELNPNEFLHHTVAIVYAGKNHKINQNLVAIGIQPNEYVIQITLALLGPVNNALLGRSQTDAPIRLIMNGNDFEGNEGSYGTTFYLTGENANKALAQLNEAGHISLKVVVGQAEYSVPIKATAESFALKNKLLQTCVAHFN